ALSALSSSRAEQQKLIVDRHNALRRGVKPTASNMMKMEWCPAAAENAQNWANKCTLRHSPPNLRRTSVTCGENVLLSSYPRTWADAIQVWYSQSSNFKYGYGAISKNVNVESYTQVWRLETNCRDTAESQEGNNPMQIAMPYRSGPKCADCPGHCDKGLCTNPCKYQDLLGNCKNLKMLFGCSHSLVKKKCPASCKCTTQII
ncbi:CRIS2 protein, partial [Passerina amoena]|nr:CRIS2 protein [Passerina amoena]